MNRNTFARLALLIGALAVLLVLQGCGGDDGVSQSLHDSVSADLGAAESRVAELEGMIGAMDDPAADSLRGMLAQAMIDLTAAQTALTTAQGDLTTAQGDLTTEKAEVTRLMTEVTRLTTALTTAMNERDMYKEMVEDVGAMEMADDMRADMDQRAMNLRAAMMETDPAPTVEVSWENGRATVELKDYTTGDAPSAIDGWTNVTLTRTRDMPVGGTDSIYVYSDIHRPSAEEFGDVYTVATDGTIQIRDTESLSADPPLYNDNKAASSKVPTRTDTTYDHWDVTLDMAAKRDAFSGTYDNVAGRFDCAATAADDCTIAVMENDDGELIPVFTGNWTFDPENVESAVMVDDDDFLTFGYWLYKPVEGEDEHIFAPFSIGSKQYDDDADPSDAADFNGVNGTATYRGSAAGKYVTRDTITESASIGLFTAKAKLDANFGTADVTDDTDDRITGNISDFVSNDGTPLTGWMLTLGATADDTSNIESGTGVIEVGDNTTSGTIAGVNIAAGLAGNDWNGTFHGNAVDRMDMQPGSVVGTFDLHGGSETQVSVSGGFGAHNISPEN